MDRKKEDRVIKAIKQGYYMSRVLDLYSFLLSLDGKKTTYDEITKRIGIKGRDAVRKYLDIVEVVFNVNIETSRGGKYSGTRMNPGVSRTVELSSFEEAALKEIIQDEAYPVEIRKWCFSILWRLGNPVNRDKNLSDCFTKPL